MSIFWFSSAHLVFDLVNWLARGNLPPLVAVAAIIERDGSILFIDRSDGLGTCLPGGIMKWGETCEATAIREVLEETGYQIAVTGLFDIFSSPDRDPRFDCVEIVYTCTIVNGTEKPSREGSINWIAKTGLPCKLGFDHELVVSNYLNIGAHPRYAIDRRVYA